MKNLIITTAMVIFILTVMGWQLKLGETLHQKQRLQYAAEEAAAAAALSAWVSADGEQKSGLVWDEERARQAAEESLRIEFTEDALPDPISAEVTFDQKGTGSPGGGGQSQTGQDHSFRLVSCPAKERKRWGSRENGRNRKSGRDRLNR